MFISSTPLDDTDPVGNIESIKILGQTDICLLQATGSDEGVDPVALNVVKVLDGGLDLPLVRLDVNDEHKGVGVLDELHGGLSSEGVLNDRELVKCVFLGSGAGCVLGLALQREGLRAIEVGLGVDPGALLGHTLLQTLGHSGCFGCCVKREQLG